MKKWTLFTLGLIPFVLGFLMNGIMLVFQSLVLPSKLISLIFLLFWGFTGFKTHRFEQNRLRATIIVNLPALLVLLALLYQEIILKQYWFNIFGVATQFFYLPLLGLASLFTFWTPYIWPIYIIGFTLMFFTYYFGSYWKINKL